VTLRWVHDKPPSAIQERARAARYALLADHARGVGAGQVATAHHADDQAETVLMRLTRGSGPAGLAAMRSVSRRGDLVLWRPLLGVPKSRLIATVAKAGHRPVDDPSNTDPRFTRARLQSLERHLSQHGLTRRALLRLAERAARAEEALEEQTDGAVIRHLEREGGQTALLSGLWREPAEIQIRLLRRAIEDKGAAPLRLERLERLHERLARALTGGLCLQSSIGGILVALDRLGKVTITSEKKRRRGRAQVDDTERSV
jgi:tRNA(Ile)-lysidine synthase